MLASSQLRRKATRYRPSRGRGARSSRSYKRPVRSSSLSSKSRRKPYRANRLKTRLSKLRRSYKKPLRSSKKRGSSAISRHSTQLRRSLARRPTGLRPKRRRPVRYPRRTRYLWYRRPRYRRYIYVDSPSSSGVIPAADSRLGTGAVTALRRKGLYSSTWRRRLSEAGHTLTDFINRFHRAEGFDLVVRAYFAGTVQRRVANLAIRTAKRLGKPAEDIKFTRSSVLDSRGNKLRTICLFDTANKTHHKLLPWSRFAAEPLTRVLESDQTALFGEPERTRYLLDKTRVTTPPEEMASAVRRTWRKREGVRRRRSQRWLEALDQTIRRV